MKDFPCWLCMLLLVLAVSLFLRGDCSAGRVELCLDNGPRSFSYWWSHYASPVSTFGIAAKFAPEAYPCVVRAARVLVDSTDEFRIHIMDGQGVDLVPPATASALEPCTFAVAEFPAGITIESGEFYVLAETISVTPQIATARGELGVLPESYLWSSLQGFTRNNAAAVIRALVDQPVRVAWVKGSGTDASNQHLFLAFDSDMDASTINSNSITVEDPDTTVAGTWLYDERLRRAEFVPDSPFPYTGFFYHVTVSEEVKDIYDNRLAAPWSGSFSVKLELDEDPPARPLSVSFNACDAAIEISWGGNMALDTVGYYVYSAPSAAGADLAVWLAQAEKVDVGNVLSTRVENLTNDVVHGVAVSAYDYCRNEGEAVYRNCVPHRGSVLLVVEKNSPGMSPEREQQPALNSVAAMQSAAFDYTVFEEAKSGLLPDADYLSAFDSVFWERGFRLWARQFETTPLLKQYMQQGGRLYFDAWVVITYGVNDKDPFLSDWLHLSYRGMNFKAFNVVGVPDNPIGDGLDLVYTSDDSFAAQIPYFEPKDGAVGFLHVKDSPDETCGLHYADAGDYGYRLVFSTAILSPVYNTEDRDKLMSRGLCWLEDKDIDFRIAANTRVLEPYSVLQLFVSANTLGVDFNVDAYLAVMVEADGGSALLFYDGTGFVSEMTPFVSGVHLESGLFLPRTKVFEYLVRDGLPSGKYTFLVALTQASTQTFLTAPRGTVVFMK